MTSAAREVPGRSQVVVASDDEGASARERQLLDPVGGQAVYEQKQALAPPCHRAVACTLRDWVGDHERRGLGVNAGQPFRLLPTRLIQHVLDVKTFPVAERH